MKYQLLLADADGTLFDFHAAEKNALKNTFAYVQIEDTQEYRDLYQSINQQLWADYEKGKVTRREIEDRRFEIWYQTITGQEGRGVEIEEYYVNQLAKGSQLLPEAQHFVEKISDHMPIEIVTNGIAYVQKNRLAASLIKDLISGIWISEEVGKAKPNPKMVNSAINKYQLDKRRVVLLGDSLKADVGAAVAAGIDCIWITNDEKKNSQATYQVSSLVQAREIILS